MSDEKYIREFPRAQKSDLSAVLRFAKVMLKKLYKNRHKAHWSEADYDYLLQRLYDEVEELKEEMLRLYSGEMKLKHRTARKAIRECADAGNFCMMIADNLQRDLDDAMLSERKGELDEMV